MKKESVKTSVAIFGALLFNSIFWDEKIGINAILFLIFILVCSFRFHRYTLKNVTGKWLFFALITTAGMVVLNNTFLSKIAFAVTALLFVSFSQYLHRSVWYAAGSSMLNYIWAIPGLLKHVKNTGAKNKKLPGIAGSFRIIVLPLVITMVFVIIYSLSNTMFSDIAINIAGVIGNWFAHFIDWFSVERLVFFLFGLFVSAGLVFTVKNNPLSIADMKSPDLLLRKKTGFIKWKESAFADLFTVLTGRPSAGTLALKTEYTIGSLSLLLLNFILLFVNLIDIKYIWAGYAFSTGRKMASYVHEGAGLLILSIVLAMLLLLFFFRGNLNFYKKNKTLRYGAYVWIFQNLLLVISVFIRDCYYITHFGLAYKRIGLLFFLAMVLVGLVTVFFKIANRNTTYYLLRINAMAGIFLMAFASTINWDVTIAQYNIARKSFIAPDVHFLLSLSDAILPLLEKNKDILENHYEGRSAAVQFLDNREQRFLKEQNAYSWLSWNFADASVLNAFKTLPKISSLH